MDEEDIDGKGVVDDNGDETGPPPSPLDIIPPVLEHVNDAPTNPFWPKLWLRWLNPKGVDKYRNVIHSIVLRLVAKYNCQFMIIFHLNMQEWPKNVKKLELTVEENEMEVRD